MIKSCLFCKKTLPNCYTEDVGIYTPHGAGVVTFWFGFGSCKYDLNMNGTEFSAYVCDNCAEKCIPLMKQTQGEVRPDALP